MNRLIRTPKPEAFDDVFPGNLPDNCGGIRDDDQIPDPIGGFDDDDESDFVEILRRGG
jgi:hypothetical protein